MGLPFLLEGDNRLKSIRVAAFAAACTLSRLSDVSALRPAIVDAGRGMGMSRRELLFRVEAPLALPLVIEGVRAAAVLVIGIAAVAAFIGVGTLGVLVFEGWGQQADDLILLGAVPMVVLALVVDAGLRALERVAVSPGIRRERA